MTEASGGLSTNDGVFALDVNMFVNSIQKDSANTICSLDSDDGFVLDFCRCHVSLSVHLSLSFKNNIDDAVAVCNKNE